MIAIVEGASGVGKSSVIKHLHAKLGAPVYRPFRSSSSEHTPGSKEPGLALLNVPVNTWMEDLFTADALSVLKPSAILDRSMPSALAYDQMGYGREAALNDTKRIVALGLWVRRIKQAGGVIVHLHCGTDECAKRSGRFTEEFITAEDAYISKYVALAVDLGVPVIDATTRDSNPEFNATKIAESLKAIARGTDADVG